MAAVETAPTQTTETARPALWHPWLALGLAVLCATSYVVALVLPYYANELHERPAGDLTGFWPYDTSLGWLVSLLAVFSFALAPVVGFGVAAWSAHRLWEDRQAPRGRLVWLAAMIVGAASVAWIFTPLAAELRVWLVD
ncbi:hypothetical protein SAMN05192575_101843 [Nocardioides alpinus]|uniref:Uncharacterized protein n=1 Tax=Nocardioides alpinus TaxID=748909 RepID=A0A1I0WA23_9ACTN|nr:hypothetical protein [Nocardioides alpinus]PKH37795.1 hypothetical protein CXG46_20570 [Nocardioides alpinus]SFA85615.1 hypothetical protein SAMN05192575_101843 [Nocardioides alpinus]